MSTVPSTSWFDVNTVPQIAIVFSIKMTILWATPTILAHSKIHEWRTKVSNNLFMPWINYLVFSGYSSGWLCLLEVGLLSLWSSFSIHDSVHLAIIPGYSNVHTLLLRIYLSTVSTSVGGKQMFCNFLRLSLCSWLS